MASTFVSKPAAVSTKTGRGVPAMRRRVWRCRLLIAGRRPPAPRRNKAGRTLGVRPVVGLEMRLAAAAQARVEDVAQRVADQVEGEDQRGDGPGGGERQARGR